MTRGDGRGPTLEWALRNHPAAASDVFVLDIAPRGAAIEWLAADLPEPAHADGFEFELDTLHVARRIVAEAARTFGCSQVRTDECVLAVSEIATNSVLYGGARGILRTWIDDGRLVYEISDRGRIARADDRARAPDGRADRWPRPVARESARRSRAGAVDRARHRRPAAHRTRAPSYDRRCCSKKSQIVVVASI